MQSHRVIQAIPVAFPNVDRDCSLLVTVDEYKLLNEVEVSKLDKSIYRGTKGIIEEDIPSKPNFKRITIPRNNWIIIMNTVTKINKCYFFPLK